MDPKEQDSTHNNQSQPQQTPPVVQDVVAPAPPPQPEHDQSQSLSPAVAPEPQPAPAQESSETDTDEDGNNQPEDGTELGGSASSETITDVVVSKEESNTDEKRTPKPKKQPKEGGNKPIGFIAIAILVSLSVMALIVMSYMNQEDEAAQPISTETSDSLTEQDDNEFNGTRPADEGFTPGDVVPQPDLDEPVFGEEDDGNSIGDGAEPLPDEPVEELAE